MDKLYESARTGNVGELRQVVIENPLILHRAALSFDENPLHLACLVGHLGFVKELLMLKPEFARERNSEGHTPMHMAAANGHVEVVKELMKVDLQLCRSRDANGRTPLHVAALRGKVGVIKEMAESIEELTLQGETALHLAVRHGQFESLSVLLECIRIMRRDEMLNKKDQQGNTVLHLATWKKQLQVLELLVANRSENSESLDVNAVNHSGLTCLDILLMFPSEAGDREMQELLQRAGGSRARDSESFPETHSQSCTNSRGARSRLVDYFKFQTGRDSPSSVRDALLIIAVLVATATYQVGINPPGGTWQDDTRSTATSINVRQHMAGKSILGSYNSVTFTVLATFNSIGFTISLFMIGILTSKFPLRVEFQICLVALYVTYNTAVASLAPESVKLFIMVFTSVLPILVPVLANLWRRCAR